MNTGKETNSTILDADSKYIPHLRRNGLSSTKYCHLVVIIAESSKDHSTIVSSHQLLQFDAEDGKNSEFHEPESTAILSGNEFLD